MLFTIRKELHRSRLTFNGALGMNDGWIKVALPVAPVGDVWQPP